MSTEVESQDRKADREAEWNWRIDQAGEKFLNK